jgi:hypothetical protein
MFTIDTESGEITCDPYLSILGATPMCSWLVVRVNIV